MAGIVMHMDAWGSLPADIQAIILNEVMPQVYEFSKRLSREVDDAAVAELQQNLESGHWVTEEGYASYYEYLPTHSLQKVQKLMIDPELLQMIDLLRPSRQQQYTGSRMGLESGGLITSLAEGRAVTTIPSRYTRTVNGRAQV